MTPQLNVGQCRPLPLLPLIIQVTLPCPHPSYREPNASTACVAGRHFTVGKLTPSITTPHQLYTTRRLRRHLTTTLLNTTSHHHRPITTRQILSTRPPQQPRCHHTVVAIAVILVHESAAYCTANNLRMRTLPQVSHSGLRLPRLLTPPDRSAVPSGNAPLCCPSRDRHQAPYSACS